MFCAIIIWMRERRGVRGALFCTLGFLLLRNAFTISSAKDKYCNMLKRKGKRARNQKYKVSYTLVASSSMAPEQHTAKVRYVASFAHPPALLASSCSHHQAACPPSILRSEPVMKDEASLDKKTAAPRNSLGVDRRPSML